MVCWRCRCATTFHLCSLTHPYELLWVIRKCPKVQVLQGGSRHCFWLAWEQDAAVLLACTCARPSACAHIKTPSLCCCAVFLFLLLLQSLAMATEVAWRCCREHEGGHLQGVQGLCVLSSICRHRARSWNVSVAHCRAMVRCLTANWAGVQCTGLRTCAEDAHAEVRPAFILPQPSCLTGAHLRHESYMCMPVRRGLRRDKCQDAKRVQSVKQTVLLWYWCVLSAAGLSGWVECTAGLSGWVECTAATLVRSGNSSPACCLLIICTLPTG